MDPRLPARPLLPFALFAVALSAQSAPLIRQPATPRELDHANVYVNDLDIQPNGRKIVDWPWQSVGLYEKEYLFGPDGKLIVPWIPKAFFAIDGTYHAETIVMATAVSAAPFLTLNGEAIYTDYGMRIDSVVKQFTDHPLDPGHQITVTRLGGSGVLADGQSASFGNPQDWNFTVGHQYLMALRYLPASGDYTTYGEYSAILNRQGQAVPLDDEVSDLPPDPISQYIDAIHAALALGGVCRPSPLYPAPIDVAFWGAKATLPLRLPSIRMPTTARERDRAAAFDYDSTADLCGSKIDDHPEIRDIQMRIGPDRSLAKEPLWDTLQWFAVCNADTMVTATALSSKPFLTLNEESVYTDYGMRVDQVFRQFPGHPLAPGKRITVARLGGAGVLANGSRVSLQDFNDMNLIAGQQYLLALRYLPGLRDYATVGLFAAFQTRGSQIVSLYQYLDMPFPMAPWIAAIQAARAPGGKCSTLPPASGAGPAPGV